MLNQDELNVSPFRVNFNHENAHRKKFVLPINQMRMTRFLIKMLLILRSPDSQRPFVEKKQRCHHHHQLKKKNIRYNGTNIDFYDGTLLDAALARDERGKLKIATL